MKVKPLGNRVLVKQLSSEEVTKSGIVLPDTADKEKKAQGKIVELGNGSGISSLGLKSATPWSLANTPAKKWKWKKTEKKWNIKFYMLVGRKMIAIY